MKNLKASNTSSVPSHMYFDRRGSSDGRNAASCWERTALLTPSAPTIRSALGELARAGLGAEVQLHAERGGALLEHVEQRAAAQRREAVAAGGDHLAPVVDVDLGPAGELRRDRGERLGIGGLDALERLVGEDDAEAERVVGGVALVDGARRARGPGAWRGSRSTARPGLHPRSRSSRLLLLSRPGRRDHMREVAHGRARQLGGAAFGALQRRSRRRSRSSDAGVPPRPR